MFLHIIRINRDNRKNGACQVIGKLCDRIALFLHRLLHGCQKLPHKFSIIPGARLLPLRIEKGVGKFYDIIVKIRKGLCSPAQNRVQIQCHRTVQAVRHHRRSRQLKLIHTRETEILRKTEHPVLAVVLLKKIRQRVQERIRRITHHQKIFLRLIGLLQRYRKRKNLATQIIEQILCRNPELFLPENRLRGHRKKALAAADLISCDIRARMESHPPVIEPDFPGPILLLKGIRIIRKDSKKGLWIYQNRILLLVIKDRQLHRIVIFRRVQRPDIARPVTDLRCIFGGLSRF